jgi:hypothetical protein
MATLLYILPYYLLSGLVVAFLLEWVIRRCDMDVEFSERLYMIFLWPLLLGIFVVYFLKGFLEKE